MRPHTCCLESWYLSVCSLQTLERTCLGRICSSQLQQPLLGECAAPYMLLASAQSLRCRVVAMRILQRPDAAGGIQRHWVDCRLAMPACLQRLDVMCSDLRWLMCPPCSAKTLLAQNSELMNQLIDVSLGSGEDEGFAAVAPEEDSGAAVTPKRASLMTNVSMGCGNDETGSVDGWVADRGSSGQRQEDVFCRGSVR